jgi:hypothetical protein
MWTDAAYFNCVSLPRLVDLDWTVHVRRSSSQVTVPTTAHAWSQKYTYIFKITQMTNMEIPSLFLRLDVEEQPQRIGEMPLVIYLYKIISLLS